MSMYGDGPPPELPGGQDDQPPDLGRALVVVLLLLADLDGYLADFRGNPPDLRVRLSAVAAMLCRLEVPDGEA